MTTPRQDLIALQGVGVFMTVIFGSAFIHYWRISQDVCAYGNMAAFVHHVGLLMLLVLTVIGLFVFKVYNTEYRALADADTAELTET